MGILSAMAVVSFTQNLRRHVDCPSVTVAATTLAAALEEVFGAHPALRGYVLDDQGALRDHVTVFVDGEHVRDRTQLTDAVGPSAEIYVMQALSGG